LCFDAWKFKNIILASENFVVHESSRVEGNLPTLETISDILIDLKHEAENTKEDSTETVYWPLTNTILVIVYTSIAKKKLELYNEKAAAIDATIKKHESLKSEAQGKIAILKEVKADVNKNTSMRGTSEESLFNRIKREAKEYVGINDGAKNNERPLNIDEGMIDEVFEANKKKIIDESYQIIENMKNIENEQEENFQNYLKKLGNSLVTEKKLTASSYLKGIVAKGMEN